MTESGICSSTQAMLRASFLAGMTRRLTVGSACDARTNDGSGRVPEGCCSATVCAVGHRFFVGIVGCLHADAIIHNLVGRRMLRVS